MKWTKLLIVSDSHGEFANLRGAVMKESPFDILVHCGDVGGDLLKILKKESNFTIKGGACSPQKTPEPEGLYYSLSGRYSLMDKNNKSVDIGIAPDFVLTKEKDGEYDYSLYADFDEISRMIDEYYGKSN